jgi:hypothetical protein
MGILPFAVPNQVRSNLLGRWLGARCVLRCSPGIAISGQRQIMRPHQQVPFLMLLEYQRTPRPHPETALHCP